MAVEFKNNKFASYLLILVTLFILLLFTKDQVMKVQANLDQNNELQENLQKERKKQSDLEEIKISLDKKGSETERYLSSFSEDEIIDYLYSYTESVNVDAQVMTIKNINISEETKGQLGFQEKQLVIDAQVADLETMKAFLDYLVASDAKYRFFVEQYSYHNDGRSGAFNIQVPLKIFFR
ncbi:MAG: hypothetical protein GY828_04140 [Candidatus Gracilibacteria bacterium]|nr:hypothetical protein [Candidatus Gracilibacteria bacterium]